VSVRPGHIASKCKLSHFSGRHIGECQRGMMSSWNQKGNGLEQRSEVKRRGRPAEEKREIAEASLKAGASVREVADAYGVHPSQVGKWRRLYRSGTLGKPAAAALLAVRVTEGVEQEETRPPSKSEPTQHGIIHVEFARAGVSTEGNADAATLRAVLECLAG
jgi:transposase-like protein